MVLIRSLGSNSSGQLATGTTNDAHHLATTQLPHDTSESAPADWRVQGGGNHAWATNGTTLLGCGSNTDGELATDHSMAVLEWTAVPYPGSCVEQVACGWSHTLLLNDAGEVYAAGSNGFGQLGCAAPAAGWVRVAGPRFVSVACGMRHSLALDKDGVVWGWGANRLGQLGIAPDPRAPNITSPVPVSKGLPPIAMIAGGRSHSVLIAQDHKTVYVAGQDRYAQCGPASNAVGTWRTFQLPHAATKLCAGWDFAAVLLDTHDVVVWGRADQGQLAQRVEEGMCCRELSRVELAGVHDIACGSSHMVALTAEGAVYMWGWNEHGNAGDPTLANVYTPLCVEPSAVGIGCGYGNSYIINQ
ncbi:alpha tubulin suppressor [Coemansia sp. 'formosensis']|nr:alpha tubulin suppressor [Coemansia sp. 'formosensis']